MRARVTWYVEVTTTSRFQPSCFASLVTVSASPRVLYGTAWKQMTLNRGWGVSPLQSLMAVSHLGSLNGLEIARMGAIPRSTSLSAGSRREFRPPERTTTASACSGGVSFAGGHTKRTALATSQSPTSITRAERRRRTDGRRYPLAP